MHSGIFALHVLHNEKGVETQIWCFEYVGEKAEIYKIENKSRKTIRRHHSETIEQK